MTRGWLHNLLMHGRLWSHQSSKAGCEVAWVAPTVVAVAPVEASTETVAASEREAVTLEGAMAMVKESSTTR